MAFPLIPPKSQWEDNKGDPLVGGSLEFLDPATDLQIDTYPTADDADGQTNREEFLAGTDPTDATSVFRFVGMTIIPPGLQHELVWNASTGITFVLQVSTNRHTGSR